ncbi:MAG: Fe-Mn family superoxide dismutase [Candidatus Babeliaceae bacterium]
MKNYLFLLFMCAFFVCIVSVHNKETNKTEQDKKSAVIPASFIYKAKIFDLEGIPFLSKDQRDQHYTLYKGYVAKLNEIRQKTAMAQRSPGITYSEYRGLKIAETFALNGVILHELYFENCIDGKDTEPAEELIQKVIESFGDWDAALKDLRDCAACARGWALMCYSLTDDKIYNFVLDAHNETVPVMAIPLLVLDVYEHAYMIDFGIDRAHYLDELFKAINWDVVEKRYKNLVEKNK